MKKSFLNSSNNNGGNKYPSVVLSISLTLAIIGLLILSGPTTALLVSVSTDDTEYKVTDNLITFTVQVDIQTNERVPIKNLTLKITGPSLFSKNCTFTTSGANLTTCSDLTITKINVINYTSGSMFGYGYSYNFTSGEWGSENQTFGTGYGYAYTSNYEYNSSNYAELAYNITWNITGKSFDAGTYYANLEAFAERGLNARIYSARTATSFAIYAVGLGYYVNHWNVTGLNYTATDDNYSVILEINSSVEDLVGSNVCGIVVTNSSNDTIPFAFQDNGNTTLDAGENITFKVQNFSITKNYIVYFNNNTPTSCQNSSFNDVRWNIYRNFDTAFNSSGLWGEYNDGTNNASTSGGYLYVYAPTPRSYNHYIWTLNNFTSGIIVYFDDLTVRQSGHFQWAGLGHKSSGYCGLWWHKSDSPRPRIGCGSDYQYQALTDGENYYMIVNPNGNFVEFYNSTHLMKNSTNFTQDEYGINIRTQNYTDAYGDYIKLGALKVRYHATPEPTVFFTGVKQPRKPFWSNNNTNASDATKTEETVYFNVTLTNGLAGGHHIFKFYNGTAWVNDTAEAWTTPAELEETRTITATKGQTVRWYWWFNNSIGNWNETDVWSFTVANTPPTISPSIPNMTKNEGTYWEYDVNATDPDVDDGMDALTWYINTTMISINSSTGLMNDTPTEAEVGSYAIKVNVTDGAAWDNDMWIYTIADVTAPTITGTSAIPNVTTPDNLINITAIITDVGGINASVVYVYIKATNNTIVWNSLMSNISSVFNATWNTTGTASGSYLVDINASDLAGNTRQADNVAAIGLSNVAEGTFVNTTVSTVVNTTTTINATTTTDTKINLDIVTITNVTNGSVTIVEYNSTPPDTTTAVGITALDKYFQIDLSSDLNASLSWIKITINYTDAEVTAAGLVENTLKIYYWNETSSNWYYCGQSGWSTCVNSDVDTTANYVWANVTSLSLYGTYGSTVTTTTTTVPAAPAAGGVSALTLSITGPDNITISAGDTKTMTLTVTPSRIAVGVALSVSGIPSDWVTISPSSADISAGSSQDYIVTITVPSTETARIITMTFTATSGSTTATKDVDLIITVIPTTTTTAPIVVCGNGVCEEGENCDNCPTDCPCAPGEGCVNGVCTPVVAPPVTPPVVAPPVPLGMWLLALAPIIVITIYVIYVLRKRRR